MPPNSVFSPLFCIRMGKLNASPWAVKKINSKCAAKQVAVYQQRLNEEAKVLKGINHPNIVGKSRHHCDGGRSRYAVTQERVIVQIPEAMLDVMFVPVSTLYFPATINFCQFVLEKHKKTQKKKSLR